MRIANAVIENAIPAYIAELAVRAVNLMVSFDQTLRTWRTRARSRRALGELSCRLLRDVGITAGDARLEANKPFWME